MQLRRERESAYARLAARAGAAAAPDLPRHRVPYRPWAPPFADIGIETGFRRSSSGVTELEARHSLRAAGDIGYLAGNAFVAGTRREPLSTLRLRLGREDPEGGLLGPLDASYFAFGDIVTPDLPLLARARPERGAVISSFPLYRAGEFDRTTLIGDLPQGWDVELYRRDVLLDFRRAGEDARFAFEDVPLLHGVNELRLVFHGPQGQRREESRLVVVGQGAVPPGEHRYRVAVSQRDTSLFGGDAGPGRQHLQGAGRVSAEYETGLAEGLSLATRMVSLPLDDGRQTFGMAGLRGSLGRVYGAGDIVLADSGDWAVQGGVQTALAGVNLSAEQVFFAETFRSERENTGGSPVRSRSTVRISGAVSPGPLPPVGYSLGAEHERRESGHQRTSLTNRLSARVGGISMANRVRVRLAGGSGSATAASGDGTFIATGRLGFARLRGGLDYSLHPDAEIHAVSGALDLRIAADLLLRTGLSHSLGSDRRTSASIGLSRNVGPAAVGAAARYSDDGAYQATVSLSFSLGVEPRSGRWTAAPRHRTNQGAVSARVFLDRNGSGVLDDGDELLEGVEVLAGHMRATTGADGVAFLTGLSSYRPAAVRIDPASLPDPFMVPGRDGVEVVARSAAVAMINLPVVITGEIDGTVFVTDASGRREAVGVELELLDAAGVVRQRTRSAFDGFYLFDQVRPGTYEVGISQGWAESRGRTLPPRRGVRITGEGEIVGGLDFELERHQR